MHSCFSEIAFNAGRQLARMGELLTKLNDMFVTLVDGEAKDVDIDVVFINGLFCFSFAKYHPQHNIFMPKGLLKHGKRNLYTFVLYRSQLSNGTSCSYRGFAEIKKGWNTNEEA